MRVGLDMDVWHRIYWRSVMSVLQTTCNPDFFSLHYGKSIGGRIIQELACRDADSRYLLIAHAIEQDVLRTLGVQRDNVIFAGVDERGRASAPEWISSVKCETVFHPKLYIKFTSDSCTCLVGSANLTSAGLWENYEAVLVVKVQPESPPEVKRLVHQMVSSFSQFTNLQSINDVTPNWLVHATHFDKRMSESVIYLDNVRSSLLDSIIRRRGYSNLKACIAYSPVYSGEATLLTKYLSSQSPGGVYATYKVIDERIELEKMHAKIYLFEFSDSFIVFLGSPNASIASFSSVGFNIVENGILIVKRRA